jgi:hypothetical protein
MLTPEGAARVSGADIPDDFGISSDMLTEEGNAFMRKAYARWSKTVRYNQEPKTKVLDQIWLEH